MAANFKVEMSVETGSFIKSLDNAKGSVAKLEKECNNASGDLKKMEGASKGASSSIGNLSNAEKRAAVEALNHSKAVKQANKELKNMESTAKSAMGSMNSAISSLKSGDIMGFASSIKNAGSSFGSLIPMIGASAGAATTATPAFLGLGTAITTALGPIGLIAAGVAAFGAVAYKSISSVEEFDKSLNSLSALTGMTGEALDDMGDRAQDMSTKFGINATDIIDSMKLIGSQAPQLLQDADAMEKVTDAANVLAKGASIEVQDSAKGITTVMNQMGVSANEVTEIINALAAGSKNGAGDVSYLQTAIEKSGTIAKSAGMDYHQLIGAIETLAPSFSSADVAGSALKGTLLKLTTQANNDFNPALVGIDKALENIEKANLSASDKVKLFGESNVTCAEILIKNRTAMKQMTDQVTNTNTAYEQMEVQSHSLAGIWDKLTATCEKLFVTLGKSAGFQFMIKELELVIDACSWLIDILSEVVDAFNTMVKVVGALVSKLYNEYIKPVFEKIYKAIVSSEAYKAFVKFWNNIKQAAMNAIKQITDLWNKFLEWLGIKSTKMNVNADAKIKVEKVDTTELDNLNIGDSTLKTGKTPKTKTTSTKTPVDKEAENARKKEELRLATLKKLVAEKEKLEKLSAVNTSMGLDNSKVEKELANIANQMKESGDESAMSYYDSFHAKLVENIRKIGGEISDEIANGLDTSQLESILSGQGSKNSSELAKVKAPKEDLSTTSGIEDAIKAWQDYYSERIDLARKFGEDVVALEEEAAQKQMELDEQLRESKIQTITTSLDALNQVAGSMGDLFGALADKEEEGSAKQKALRKMQFTMNLATALANGVAQAMSLSYPANIAAAISTIATVGTLFAKMPKFASGGVIKGSSSVGDNLLARVNGGEMILNGRQQQRLFNMLNYGGAYQTQPIIQQLEFKVKGKDLLTVLENYDKKYKR